MAATQLSTWRASLALTAAKIAAALGFTPYNPTQTLNAQTGTTYTLVLTDVNKLVTLSNASSITVTIPPNSSVAISVGQSVDFAQMGAGQVTFSPGSGVTLRYTPGAKLRAQYSPASAIKIATDEWLILGDLSA